MYKVNLFILICNTNQEKFNDYDKKTTKLENIFNTIWAIIHLTIVIILVKKADIKRITFFTTVKVAIFISDPEIKQNIQFIVLDK